MMRKLVLVLAITGLTALAAPFVYGGEESAPASAEAATEAPASEAPAAEATQVAPPATETAPAESTSQ